MKFAMTFSVSPTENLYKDKCLAIETVMATVVDEREFPRVSLEEAKCFVNEITLSFKVNSPRRASWTDREYAHLLRLDAHLAMEAVRKALVSPRGVSRVSLEEFTVED